MLNIEKKMQNRKFVVGVKKNMKLTRLNKTLKRYQDKKHF